MSFREIYQLVYDPNIRTIVKDTNIRLKDMGRNDFIICIAQSHVKEHAHMLYNTIRNIILCYNKGDISECYYYIYTDNFEIKMDRDNILFSVNYIDGEDKESVLFNDLYKIDDVLSILYHGLFDYFRYNYLINFKIDLIVREIWQDTTFDNIENGLKEWARALRQQHEYYIYRINLMYIDHPYYDYDKYKNENPYVIHPIKKITNPYQIESAQNELVIEKALEYSISEITRSED